MFIKRIFFLLLLVIFGIVTVYFLTGHIDENIDPARLLPVDTLIYADIIRPAENHRKFRHSRLGRNIYSIKWDEVLRALDVPEDLIQNFTKQYQRAREFLESSFFHEFCGRRATLAFLPGNSSLHDGTPSDLLGSLVFISRPNHRASFLDLLSVPLLQKYEFETESYLGKEIRTFALDNGIRVSTAVSDGFFVTGFSSEVVKQSLDLSMKSLTKGKSGLMENPEYASLRQRTRGKVDQFLYLDLTGLLERYLDPAAKTSSAGQDEAEIIADNFPYKSMSFFRRSRKNTLNYTTILRFNPRADLSGQVQPLYPPPETVSFLREVPADLLAFYWTNLFDFPAVIRSLRADGQGVIGQLLEGMDELLTARAGISLDRFLDHFGSRFSVNVSEVWTDGFLPMPKLSFRLEVRKPRDLLETMEKLVEGQQVSTSTLGGTEIHSVQLAGGLIQPAYALKDNFLIIADSLKQMQMIVGKKKRSLVSDPLFRSVDVGMTKPSNMVVFVRNRELVEALKEVAVWTGALLALNDQERGLRSRVIIDQVVLPILDGMKMYQAKGTRLFSSESELVLQSALLLDLELDEEE